jgi:hypothetical protein
MKNLIFFITTFFLPPLIFLTCFSKNAFADLLPPFSRPSSMVNGVVSKNNFLDLLRPEYVIIGCAILITIISAWLRQSLPPRGLCLS